MSKLNITGVKPGSTSLKLTAGKVAKTIPVNVPMPASLPANRPAAVTLDATHVKHAGKAVKITAPADNTQIVADLFPDYKPTKAETIGVWVWVEPTALAADISTGYARVAMGRIGQAGSMSELMGTTQLNGLHAGWNLCMFTSVAYQHGATLSFRTPKGGSVWVDSLVIDPLKGRKGTIVFTHDVNPHMAGVNLVPLYAKYGLSFDWDAITTHNGVSVESVTAIKTAGHTDWGMYSGIPGATDTPDYTSGDWSAVVKAMTDASRIDNLPRASYVASTNNRLGPAYTLALAQAGWPLIRGTHGDGVSTSIDPDWREVMTVTHAPALKSLDQWAAAGYTIVVTEHDVKPDAQATGSTDTKLSEFEPLLAKAKQLKDAGLLDVLTMRELAARDVPGALDAWDKNTD